MSHWEWFKFDNIKSSDYGVWISGEATFNTPERDVTVVEVPGRNGTLTYDNGRWKNVQITYPCFMSGDFSKDFDAFKNAIMPKLGYLRLEDTYHPNGYRMGRLYGGIKPKPGPYNRSAQFDLTFDCWPQFFLLQDSDLFPTSIQIIGSPYTLENIPLVSYSQPSVRVYLDIRSYGNKSGSVTIGDHTMTYTNLPYASGDNMFFLINSENKTITMTKSGGVVTDVSQYCSGEFFELLPPETTISYTGDTMYLWLYPKWWRL